MEKCLSAFESCRDYEELKTMVNEIKQYIPKLRIHVVTEYSPETDTIDKVAQSEIPLDGPVRRVAVFTVGDGNCLTRSVGKSFFNDPSKHLELHARIVIEAVTNMEQYLSHQCLERGATYIHANAELLTVFATFSEYYTPG